MNSGALRLHPEADIVPPMTPDEYDAFLTDVLDRGITTAPAIEAPVLDLEPVAPINEASLPEWARAWRCADCGSRPAAEPVPMLGDLGRAPCPACGAARYFRRTA